jgi:glycosyltransferase involved in cell wall biosynthesis
VRVLYLNPFSQEVSGPDESLRTLLAALIPLGVEAHVVLPRPGPQVSRYEALGARVHFAPLTILRRHLGATAGLLPFQLARGVWNIAKLVRREKIDLIHTNMEVVLDGAVASRLLRIPHVLHYRGNSNDHPKAVFDVLTHFWTWTSEKVFCISNATAALFRRRRLTAKVEVLYNPVDLAAFAGAVRTDHVRNELGAGTGDLLVGTIGRIHPRKDVETFIRAAALTAEKRLDARFAIVGNAEAPEEVAYETHLRALSTELGIAHRLVWAGARRDMPSIMKALDVFVLCSRHEGFGRVVAEALAAGTPLVVSNEGAPPELIAGAPRAIAATPGDPGAFAAAVERVAGDSTSSDGAAAARFAPETISGRVLGCYSMLLRRTRVRG